jgi:hypothetical protein
MKRFLIGFALIAMAISASLTAFAAGPWGPGGAGWGSGGTGGTGDCPYLGGVVGDLPMQEVSQAEEADLSYMRQEEKLARDVYSVLYQKWALPAFNNISDSEQQHMDAVKLILDKYSLDDPVTSDEAGDFQNQALTALYGQLVEQGMTSLTEAIKVGIQIEELDIADLEETLTRTDNQDIQTVYQNLLAGSRNHLRAFNTLLTAYGQSYSPQALSQERYDQIVMGAYEMGLYAHDGNDMCQ